MKLRRNGLRLAIAATATTAACAVTTGHIAIAQDTAVGDLTAAVTDLATLTTTAGIPSDLVITEILPNTTGHDEFEFFEVHNTGTLPATIGEGEYTFAYSYTDSADTTRDVALDLGETVTVAPGETVVIWLNYTASNIDSFARSEQEFRDFYGMDNSARVLRATGQSGMANGGDRGIRILHNGEVSSWSHYPSGSAGVQLGIEFALPVVGERSTIPVRTQTAPTPGTITADQLLPGGITGGIPEAPEPDPELDLEVDLDVDQAIFEGLTPPTAAAPLVLTELLANSDNVGGSDAYEFIEITNTTAEPVDFSDYTLNYLYPQDEFTNTNAAVWASQPGDVVIAPGASLVFWIKNGPNNDLTAADFNAVYGTNLTAGVDLVEINSGGMANGSARGIQIQTNTGHIINRGYYNLAGASDVELNRSLNYAVDAADLFKQTLLGNASPTPGTAHPTQLPDPLQQVVADNQAPVVTDTTSGAIAPDEPFTFSFEATDNELVRTLTLNLRSNISTEAQEINLTADAEGNYSWQLPAADITGKVWFEYTVTATDGTNTTTTDPVRLGVDGANTDPVRLNLTDNQWVNGTTDVIGASDTFGEDVELLIDDAPVTTSPSLPAAPTFAMEITQTDVFFRNGILAGGEELLIFDEGTYERIESVSTAVPLYHLNDDGTVTVSVYAGTKAAAAIDPNENNDDFQIRNLRLILPDGRTLTPAGITDQQEWLKMGDSAGKLDFFDATFTLPEDAYTGVAHAWDTTGVTDGEHTVTVTRADGETISRTVRVDNTGPELNITGVTDGAELRGAVEINATATDTGAGVDSIETLLNGERVELPFTTGSLDLPAGEHTITIRAEDKVGNRTEQTITFTTPEENPISGDFAPSGGETVPAGDVTLTARADDPSGDDLDLTFLEADTPALDSGRVRMATGTVADAATTDRAGATRLSREDVDKLAGLDGLGTEVASDTAFPYQLFEVDAADNLATDTQLRVNWAGNADGRAQVMLYALKGSEWVELDRHLTGAEAEDFTLGGLVNAAEFADNGTVTMLVQHSEGFAGPDHTTRDSEVTPAHPDDVPRSDYDFTLAWESDTQYYNEQYTQHQESIHDYLLEEYKNKNIQFLFHTGDVVDNYDQPEQWANAVPQYDRLDEAGLPYSILAGNHDVDYVNDDFSEFSRHFGEARFADNPWYMESFRDNRGHYDLFSAGGIDFINVAMGWAPGDDAIAWMNEVLAKHPERVAILNLHEFMLTTGGLGPIPQRILDEVAATNPNVRMIMSGHYHDAYQRTDSFDDDGDGIAERTVTSMLFDYQGLPEGGQGFLRLLHFDNEGEKMMVRTYSPSLGQYNSDEPSLMGPAEDPWMYQSFDLPYAQLGIEPEGRTLTSDSFSVDFLTSEEIGSVSDVASGDTGSVVWEDVPEGRHSWYVRTEDPFGGVEISPVQSFIAGEGTATDGGGNGSSAGSSDSGRAGFLGAVGGFFAGAAALAGAAFAFIPNLWEQVMNALGK